MSLLIKKTVFWIIVVLLHFNNVALAQEEQVPLKNLFKTNIVNPGVEIQKPTSQRNLISINVGIGQNVSYPELTLGLNSGFIYLIAPTLDLQNRFYLNRNRLASKKKNLMNNSGSFLVVRVLLRGQALYTNIIRTSNFDGALGLGYGFQKSKDKVNFAFTICPYLYFDEIGNWGFFPFIPEFSIGYNIR